MNLDLIKDGKVNSKELRQFGFSFAILFSLLIGVVFPLITIKSLRLWPILFSFPFFISALFCPTLLFYPFKFWMKFGFIMGRLNSSIVFGLLYLILLIPLSFIMRLFKHNPLKYKFTKVISYREAFENKKNNFDKTF